ncbi:FAD-binding oxidoreductase, partial [Chloroflexota bacterium]
MGKIKSEHRSYLEEIFNNRVSFRRLERKLYGHDIAAMPGLIKPFVGNTISDAVVQPESEEELIGLVKWAVENKVALTPRGSASSGYGGVIPVKGGVVVDFYRMRAIKKIDATHNTVIVEPGIVWEKLDKELMKQGLTLRLYPSSYPSATVGGWLAQGGAGIGSYEAGWFRDNVISARVVIPDGSVKEFRSNDIDLISSTGGITGLISEVTLLVQPMEDLEVIAVGCPDAYDLQKMAQDIIKNKLPIWSLVFINPRMAELKNKAPLLEHFEHPVEERVLLPASYIMTLAFRKKDSETVTAGLTEVMKPYQAELLSERIAKHEWKNRFKIMIVKRLGPSLVPAEVVIPLVKLGDFIADVENKIDQPVVKEGIVIRKGAGGEPEVVILGFIPSDQRRFSYNFVFTLSLTIMKIAEAHSGRAYATGLYFAGKAKKVLGVDNVRRIKEFKKRYDSKGILN